MRCYTILSKQDPNKITENEIDNCCDEYKAAFLVTYSSGRTWLVCPYCDQDEAFQLGRTSRTRLS